VVREGDTLARIARRYHTTIAAIATASGLRGDRLRPGQTLIVPREGEPFAAPPSRGGAAATRARERELRRAAARARRLGLGAVRTGQRLLAHAPEQRWRVAAAAGGRSRLSGTLRLPVDGGRLIRGWGSGEGGYHLAIDIRGPLGATIRAAERGIVAYAGDQISGYGHFVMVVHPNGWVTAYAHNRENLVVPGQIVRRGDPIARLGSTGRSRAPHLHFMLIDHGAHCDALPLFDPPLVAGGARVAWRGARRPSEVRCLPRSARPHPTRSRRGEGAGDHGQDLDGDTVDDSDAADSDTVDDSDAADSDTVDDSDAADGDADADLPANEGSSEPPVAGAPASGAKGAR
jgi:murein DD-endopeptidase MepM/ murein hydrolase activator NlpD